MKNFIFLSLIVCHSVFAVPSLINYQGRLTDPNGDALTGNKIMSVSIYDAAIEGTSLYTEEVGSIPLDSNGIYSFSFGTNQTALTSALQTAGEHWLELTVDGTSQTPRERILSVPFAKVAGSLTQNLQNQIDDLNSQIGYLTMAVRGGNSLQNDLLKIGHGSYASRVYMNWETIYIEAYPFIDPLPVNEKIKFIQSENVGEFNFNYSDGTSAAASLEKDNDQYNLHEKIFSNPFPSKTVTSISNFTYENTTPAGKLRRLRLFKIIPYSITINLAPTTSGITEYILGDYLVHASILLGEYWLPENSYIISLIGENGEQLILPNEITELDSSIGSIGSVRIDLIMNDSAVLHEKILNFDFYREYHNHGIEQLLVRFIPLDE